MDKQTLVKEILGRLTENLGILEKAARAAHAEATHESSKAENKYDTRGLEASYLAGGQSRQAKEISDAIKVYETLRIKAFGIGEPIDLTALVDLEIDGLASIYFVGPRSGGLEIKHKRDEVTVITPQSPLGQMLIGKKQSDRWAARFGAK